MRELTEGKCLVKKVENAPSELERCAEANVPRLSPSFEEEVAEKLREWKTVLEYEQICQLAD